MSQKTRMVIVAVAALALIVPVAALASDRFTDVPDSNIFHDDITWLADTGITIGCNPPDNTEFCPKDFMTREQMAAFVKRMSINQVVDAGALLGYSPAEITNLSGENTAEPIELAQDTPTVVLEGEPLTANGEAVAMVAYSVTAGTGVMDELAALVSAWLQVDDPVCDLEAGAVPGTVVTGSNGGGDFTTIGSTYLLTFDTAATVTLCAVSEGAGSTVFQAALNFVGNATTN